MKYILTNQIIKMDNLLQKCIGSVQSGAIQDPKKMYALDGPKYASKDTTVSAVYWLSIDGLAELKYKYQKKELLEQFPWFDILTFKPERHGGGYFTAAITVWYQHSQKLHLIGVPRYLGLSLFGPAKADNRLDGQALSVTFQGQLRGHQVECIDRTMKILETWQGATMVADCGVGKTAMALYVLSKLQRKTAIVCNRSILMDQWADAIQRFLPGLTVSWLQGTGRFDKGYKTYASPDSASDIMLCSIETLATGEVPKSLLDPYGLLVVDEMHHLAAASLVNVVPMFRSRYTLGLTATPNRADGLEYVLYWLMGPASCVYQRVPEITGVRHTVEIRKMEFTKGQRKEIIYENGTMGFSAMITALTEDPERNQELFRIIDYCLENRKRTIVVTAIVNHAKELYEYTKTKEPTTAMIAGTIRHHAKQAKVTIATYSLLEEGYDDPSLDTLILATPRSTIQQTIGRIERDHPDKDKPVVFDLVDTFSLFPNMYWKRNKFYSTRGFKTVIFKL
jgi:superfamily II DNA or RNA helicase